MCLKVDRFGTKNFEIVKLDMKHFFQQQKVEFFELSTLQIIGKRPDLR